MPLVGKDLLPVRHCHCVGPVFFAGHIILEIQGASCNTPHNFDLIKKEIENLIPEVPFSIKVLRGGQIIELKALKA